MTGQAVTTLVREGQTYFSLLLRHAQICHEDLCRPELETLASMATGHASVCIPRGMNKALLYFTSVGADTFFLCEGKARQFYVFPLYGPIRANLPCVQHCCCLVVWLRIRIWKNQLVNMNTGR